MLTSISRRIFRNQPADKDGEPKNHEKDEATLTSVDDNDPEGSYVLCSIYYLSIILFIGLPIWFYTCSPTRYSLPNLDQLDAKLSYAKFESNLKDNGPPRLHLDISVVQLAPSSGATDNGVVQQQRTKQAEFLRANLPNQVFTSNDDVAYNIDWRIRRPTSEETNLVTTLFKDSENHTSSQRNIFDQLEQNLLRIQKASSQFRLFIYLFDEPFNSLICDKPNTYILNHERFVYLCPGEQGNQSIVDLIRQALKEIYSTTINFDQIKNIISGKTDLIVSFVPEHDSRQDAHRQASTIERLWKLAEVAHNAYNKNVKDRHKELTEILNIRFMTQNLIDLLQDQTLVASKTSQSNKKGPKKQENNNDTIQIDSNKVKPRVCDDILISQLYGRFESRLNKFFSKHSNHILAIVTNEQEPELVLSKKSVGADINNAVSLQERRDANFLLIANNEKSIVLGLRAIVRRLIGLKSVNLCANCIVRRDVFINKWELDAIVGALTITKLHNTLLSLRSISQHAIGIRIPKDVSQTAHEAYELAIKSIECLEGKKTFEAYRSVNTAYEKADAAFYNPSLLETLYFPHETKFAIYMPLFFPITFQFISSIRRIITYFSGKTRGKKEKVD